jgi:hypothetical protein
MEIFHEDLKNWYLLDNKLKNLSLEINSIKNKKNLLKNNIIDFILENNLEQKTIKINNAEFKFINLKQTQPLTFKFLKNCLDNCISNENQVEELIQYIKSKREIKESIDLKKLN